MVARWQVAGGFIAVMALLQALNLTMIMSVARVGDHVGGDPVVLRDRVQEALDSSEPMEERPHGVAAHPKKEAAGAGARLVGLSRRKKSGHPIFFPCIPMEEAEAKGIPQFMSIRPPNTTHGEWERIQRCWRPRGGTEDPVGDGDLPPTGGLELRMEQRELEDGLFVHQGNVERLERGNSILRGEGGEILIKGEVLRSLPEGAAAALDGQQHADCAVVGSGGSLLGTSQGAKIDRHAVVLRINQAPTKGYERYVGNKTSIRLVNNLWSHKYSVRANCERKQGKLRRECLDELPLEAGVTLLLSRVEGADLVRTSKYLRARGDVRVRVLASRAVSLVRQRLLAPWRARLNATGDEALLTTLYDGRDTPSSGLLAVFYLMQVCGKVTVYGFGGRNDSNRYHYFKTARNYMNRTHSFSAERALLRALARDGHVVFVDGNSANIKSWV